MTDLIATYAQRLEARGRSKATIYSRERNLHHANRRLPHGLEEACGDEITAFLAAKDAIWTKGTYYYSLKSFYALMVKLGKLETNPMDSVDPPRSGDHEPNPVSDEELRIALELSPDQPWRAAVILAAYAGLRCAELCGIRGVDITPERVHVIQGKGGKSRYVPTHPAVWALRERMGKGHLIVTRRGTPFKPNGLSCNQRPVWERMGLEEVHLHRFRHWFGTTLVEQGVGIEIVSTLMGHSSVATTQGYVRVSTKRKQAAILTLPLPSAVQPEPVGSRLGLGTTEAA